MIFDGYDLVVYGAVVPTFLRDPSQIGHVSPAMAGALGSYALVGALLAGTVSDIIGRRKVMLAAYAWFAIGIPVTALTSAVSMFGLLRFLTREPAGGSGPRPRLPPLPHLRRCTRRAEQSQPACA